jgi:antibiotic biosynthesis monooxygenase (ABM) superfamily enzyme
MKEGRYLWLVTSKATPGKEEEYNKWYDQHVTTFFKFPGLKRVVRNKCYQPMQNPDSCPQYVVIYEFDKKEDLEAFAKSDVAEIARKEMEERWEGLGDFLWSGWYEPVKKLER